MTARVVMVVEDNAELRHVLKEALGAEGYSVLSARDELEALEVLKQNHVDLYISDLTDPRPVPVALEAVRKAFPDLPVVALSPGVGHHPTLFFTAWHAPKGVRLLPKPFRLGELLAASREVLAAAG
jgi:two-component system cell cycle sensor histidine kinase/response regulator CckA